MKILIVSPTPTHPFNAGNRIRILRLVEQLRTEGNDIDFIYYTLEGPASSGMQTFFGDSLYEVKTAGLWKRALRNKLKKLFWKTGFNGLLPDSFYQYSIDSWYDERISEVASLLHQKKKYDMVIAEYAFLSKVLTVFGNDVIKVVDAHDKLTDRQQIFLSQGQMPDWFACTREEEAKGFERTDRIIAIQSEEAAYFRTLVNKPVLSIGVTFDFSETPLPMNKTVGFFASDNFANIQALNFIQNELWPILLKRDAKLRLVIAGKISAFAKPAERVEIIGRTKTTAEAYSAMTLALNPVEIGTGLKIKSLEALAHGRYLISTSHSAIGTEQGIGQVVFTAQTGQQFASTVLQLLADTNRMNAMQSNCIKFIQDYNTEQRLTLKELLQN